MKRLTILTLLTLSCLAVWAEAFPTMGNDSVSAEFFRRWYHYGDLTHYLDNYSDYSIYEAETTGEWAHSDRLVFSVSGNSFKQSKYYIEGFRTDSRLNPGSSAFRPNMQQTDMTMDYLEGTLSFSRASDAENFIAFTGNRGSLGGISPGTRQLINLFHTAATERILDNRPITYRPFVTGAGTAEAGYAVPLFGRHFYQHLTLEVGHRQAPAWDRNGITSMEPSLYFNLSADGQIPLRPTSPVKNLNYLFAVNQRHDAMSEFLFNADEQGKETSYTFGMFINDTLNQQDYLNAGVSLEMQDMKHRQLSFRRNLIDQDGEAFEPWYTDGLTTAVNTSVNYSREWLEGLRLRLKGYNSVLHHSPYVNTWSNEIYVQGMDDPKSSGVIAPTHLYDIKWTAQAFTAGLLENQLTIDYEHRFNEVFSLNAYAGLTIDGMLMSRKSIISPNWIAGLKMDIQPCPWFRLDVNLSHNRMSYTIDDVRFFSNDYLNGVADMGGGNMLTTGGRYHAYDKNLGLQQPSYFVLDFPFRFTFGKNVKNELSFLQQGRIYYNQWTTVFTDGVNNNGSYDADGIFFFSPAQERQYTVKRQEAAAMSDKWIMSNPYYLSSVVKYTLESKHVLFSVSWQSYLMGGVSTLGNGVLHNNIGVLSESTANPNTWRNERNAAAPYPIHGRTDQDRAYIARILLTYNINDYIAITFNGKFKDGVPFSNFKYKTVTDNTTGSQTAIWNDDTKGINLTDNHFGKREDAFFDFDLRLTGRWTANERKYEVSAVCYNIYDFGTALTEYTFDDKIYESRTTMSLCIPRGLIVSLKVGL